MEHSEQFKEWYIYKYLGLAPNQPVQYIKHRLKEFDYLRWAEQWGVVLDFFEHVGIIITVGFLEDGWSYEVTELIKMEGEISIMGLESRKEAQKAARDSALEIFNKRD